MPCRVGITTNPGERKRYWEGQYPTLRNWQILARCDTKSEAQKLDNHFVALYGCQSAPGGAGAERDDWIVYKFEYAELEGLDEENPSFGEYPIDEFLIRRETRTVENAVKRIKQGVYIMDPDFQRDFIWSTHKQSKLIESVAMRIPLPVFYIAENDEGKMIVVDGLQRMTTFQRFLNDELKLVLEPESKLHNKRFSDLPPKLQNRIEDCNLTFYLIDSKVPERARLDIFERVNSGEPLTRQQMRNSIFMGKATRFLKKEAQTDIFREATGHSLDPKTMRDREFVNRFCAFQILGIDEYRGDMDDFLARCLRTMNKMEDSELSRLSDEFRRGLANNYMLFEKHAFRKKKPANERRSVLNASLWDVMSTGLSRYTKDQLDKCADSIHKAVHDLFDDEDFNTAITYGPNDLRRVKTRFQMTRKIFKEIIDADTN